jgi:hypothetical protein
VLAESCRNRENHWCHEAGHRLVDRWLAGCAKYFPQFANLIVNMPRPVMAAALFFNGALMFVAGIQIVVSRPITLRAR